MDPRVLRGRETSVVDAYEAGQSVEEIAARNGCSVDPVQRVLQRAGVEPPLLPNPLAGHEGAVAAAFVSGTSVEQLARRFGATSRSIRRALAAEGIDPPPT